MILQDLTPTTLIVTFIISFEINYISAQYIQSPNSNISEVKKPITDIYSNSDKDSLINDTALKKSKPSGLKDPFEATVVAIFPGLIVRGLGHFYADKYITGSLLIIIACFGIYLDIEEEKYIPEEGDTITDEKYKRYDLIHYSSRILFFGSWAYDIIGAPIVCIRHNKRLQQKISINPYMEYNRFGQQTGVRLSLWS